MDAALVTWARRVKRPGRPPPLWFFTDTARTPDPAGIIARLPAGLCGVVFRHDEVPDRAILARRVSSICRARRLWLSVPGDPALALSLRAGVHLRRGRQAGLCRAATFITASAHSPIEVRRARQAGAAIIFCSPVFTTASHPGAAALGVAAWQRLARHAPPALAYALGGIDGSTIRRLGRSAAGAGAIEAFLR